MAAHLPSLRRDLRLDLVVANAENASAGLGLAARNVDEILRAGVDCITTGNHVWKFRDLHPLLEASSRLLRPANYPAGVPGRGLTLLGLADGRRAAIMNLQGRTFMPPVDCPFAAAERLLDLIPADVTVRILDVHAEATSEKIALGLFLDGRVSAVLGTHTHVPTADARVLPGGTAYVTDAGMCGPAHSCLGMDPGPILRRMRTGLPEKFEVAAGPAVLQGVVFDIDEASGRATGIRPLNEREEGIETAVRANTQD